MNKQPSSTIMTRLGWGVFFLALVFLAFQVIPHALGQRDAGKQSVTGNVNRTQATARESGRTQPVQIPNQPQAGSGPGGAHRVQRPPPPQFPQVILYDQYNNAGTNATSSQDFELAFDPFDDFTADDFVVPGGQTWSVESVDADGTYAGFPGPVLNFNVFFYSDSGGLPGALVASHTAQSYVQVGSTFTVTLSPAVSLGAGTYWVSVQARMDFTVGGQWYWTDRTVQSNSAAAWQNPGGGFGVCTTWGQRGGSCGIDPGVPDQVYRLNGTTGGGGTPTPTPTPTPPGNALWYNGDFDGNNGLANQENVVGSGLYSRIYDDFNVTDANGWDVTELFSDNLSNTTITGATWEIRQGVSEGNGGTLIASGMTVTPIVTPTGRSGFGFTEFMVLVPGLSVHLPTSANPYWLNVAPIGSATGQAFDSTTSGANCVGTPCGNDANAFWDSSFFGVTFTSTLNGCDGCADFSMGINGTVTGGGGGNLKLRAGAHIADGTKLVRLHWKGATTDTVDIYRNDELLATTVNDGDAVDTLTERGIFVYKVCEAGSSNCSNEVTVKFRGP
jgi:hypothetical protein